MAGAGDGSLSARWQGLGAGSTLRIASADLWMVELPFVRPVVTSVGEHRTRPLVMIRLTVDSGGTRVEGWGESAALAAGSDYDPEHADAVFATLEHTLVPALGALVASSGRLPGPAGLGQVRNSAPDRHLAFAALEMAVADAHLRAEGRSLADLLGVEADAVALGAVVGMEESTDQLLGRVHSLVEDGYSRLKLKIGPGWDTRPLAAVHGALSSSRPRSGPGGTTPVRLQADANGSYRSEDAGDRDRLIALDGFGLLCIEQPYGRDQLPAHAHLAARLRTPICLDEGVRSGADISRALQVGACSVVCLKPARLGGLGEALTVVERCRSDGHPLWMGGMFESGYARGVNTTLAGLAGFSWPGDLSPARTYLGTDLVAPPDLTRLPETGALAARPPTGPGLGAPPSLDVISSHAVGHVDIAPF